jgi:hypothetical protein
MLSSAWTNFGIGLAMVEIRRRRSSQKRIKRDIAVEIGPSKGEAGGIITGPPGLRLRSDATRKCRHWESCGKTESIRN